MCCMLIMTAAVSLAPGNWEPSVKAELEGLIRRNSGNPAAYAVFDFDNTTAIGDISNVCQWRMLETLAFKSDFAAALKSGIPTRYHARIDSMVSCIPLLREMDEKVRVTTPTWHGWARAYWSLYRDLLDECGTDTAYPWIGHLFAGYTSGEYQNFARAAAQGALSAKTGLSADPDAPDCFPRGLALTAEMLDLFHAFERVGIATYIVSASNRELVFAMTDGTFGLKLGRDRIFGYRLRKGPDGRYLPFLDESQPRPQGKGKVEIIRRFIAPRHQGADPVLTAGDSMGDFDMMTAFPKLQAALVFNRNPKTGPLADLIRQATTSVVPRILVQGRDSAKGRLVPSHESK